MLSRALGATRTLDTGDIFVGLESHAPRIEENELSAGRTVVRAAIDRGLRAMRSRNDQECLPIALADAACGLGALGDFASANDLLVEAAARAGDNQLRLRNVTYAAARIAYWRNDATTAVELLAETLLPADHRTCFEMLLILAWGVVVVDGRSALARGLDFVSRAEAIIGAGGLSNRHPNSPHEDPVSRAQCAKARSACFHFAGDYARSADASAEGFTLARRAGLRSAECVHLHNTGEQYLLLGEHVRARAMIVEARDLARDMGAERYQMLADVLLSYLDRQPELLDALAERGRSGRDGWLELYATYWLARLLASTDSPDARDALERALSLARELKVRTMTDDCTRALAALSHSAA
jgi:hypothetical protein